MRRKVAAFVEMSISDLRNEWRESHFQAAVINLARANGWRVAHFRPVRVQRKDGTVHYQTPVEADGAGFPDLVCVKGGRVVALELKVGKNTTSADQDAWIAAFQAGHNGFVMGAVVKPADWEAIEGMLS